MYGLCSRTVGLDLVWKVDFQELPLCKQSLESPGRGFADHVT